MKIILNPFWSMIVLFKVLMLIVFLYYFSLVYSGWLLPLAGGLGILWVFQGVLNELNMYTIKKELEKEKTK